MNLNIYITVIVFITSLPLVANDVLEKDIQDSLASIDSMQVFYYTEKQEKMEVEAERLVKLYGMELVEPMNKLAIEKLPIKRRFALTVLVKLDKSDSVKQTFIELVKNPADNVSYDAIYMLAKMGKDFTGDVVIGVINTTDNSKVRETVVPVLGILGDPNTLSILKNMEQSNKDTHFIKVAHQARIYLETRLNLPDKEAQKSWADQAFVYWLLLREVQQRNYITLEIEYYEAAKLMAQRGHRFSLNFIKYHLTQKDPLVTAIIAIQKDQDAVEALKMQLNEKDGKGEDTRTFRAMGYRAIEAFEEKDEGPGKPEEKTKDSGKPG